MILEVAVLNIVPGKAIEFEEAFDQAQYIISKMKGYISHELQKCMENNHQYILFVKWETLEENSVWKTTFQINEPCFLSLRKGN